MTKAKATTTVTSQERSARAKKILADLPRDPVTGRLMKRDAAPAAGGSPPPAPAGGPDPAPPFVPGRGLRRWRRPRSG